jgi:hypothetical protein
MIFGVSGNTGFLLGVTKRCHPFRFKDEFATADPGLLPALLLRHFR